MFTSVVTRIVALITIGSFVCSAGAFTIHNEVVGGDNSDSAPASTATRKPSLDRCMDMFIDKIEKPLRAKGFTSLNPNDANPETSSVSQALAKCSGNSSGFSSAYKSWYLARLVKTGIANSEPKVGRVNVAAW